MILYRDLLCELASVGHLPLPQSTPVIRSKRIRSDDDDGYDSQPSLSNTESSSAASNSLPPDERRNAEDAWKASPDHLFSDYSPAMSDGQIQPPSYMLPMYTNELGRLPLHGQFSFTNHINVALSNPPNPPAYQVPEGVFADSGFSSIASNNPSLSNDTNLADPRSLQYTWGQEPIPSSMESWNALLQPLVSANAGAGGQPSIDNDRTSMWPHAQTPFEYVSLPSCVYEH
jgi:hypothetical protein